MRKINVTVNDLKISFANEKEARKSFAAYKEAGIIKSSLYDDIVWKLSDEIGNYFLDFKIDEKDFADYSDNLGINASRFSELLKIYIIFKLGEISLTHFRQFLCDIKKIIKCHFDDLTFELSELQNMSTLVTILDFFKSISSEDHEEEYKYLTEGISRNIEPYEDSRGQRKLVSFDSYFAFNDVLKLFWKECKDKDEKLFFFPVWFWWTISAVIPMRPREVVITPRDCIKNINGEWHLTIRKDKLKGNSKKKTYKIDSDYSKFTFVISESFAKDILWYIENTEDYPDNELKTLFVTDTHYKRWERSKPYTSRYFTYINLNTCLRYFFEFIIDELYGYTIINDIDRKHLKSNEIQKFSLGDTRHLAMIGVIFSGAPASIAKVLAAHDSIDIGAHYYSNISSFVETQTYRNYKRITTTQPFQLSEYRKPIITENYKQVKNGKCYSNKYANGNYDDCINSISEHGEIAKCSCCRYFRSNGFLLDDSKSDYEKRIEKAYKALLLSTNAVRKAKGYEEDIVKQIIEINSIANDFSKYLYETKGNKQWEDNQ